MLNLDEALDFTIDVARSAGMLLTKAFERLKREGSEELGVRTKKSARDFVTIVDAETQKHIIDRIRERYPDHRFIAEEEGADKLGNPACPHAWVIDPLDGTTNFLHGKPTFATMIALMEGSTFTAGVIYFPIFDEIFHGQKGTGAFWNGKPVQLRHTKDMNDAILSTNVTHRLKPCTNGELHVALPLCGSVHNYGCAAQELGEILRGSNDGVFYQGVGLWDIAPGCLMIEETSGKVRWEFVDPNDPRKGVNCVATTKEVFAEVEGLIFRES